MSTDKKHREFWIIKKFRPIAYELRLAKPKWNEIGLGNERIHVIEISALEDLKADMQKLVEALELAADVIHGEFCGELHHQFCITATEALEQHKAKYGE